MSDSEMTDMTPIEDDATEIVASEAETMAPEIVEEPVSEPEVQVAEAEAPAEVAVTEASVAEESGEVEPVEETLTEEIATEEAAIEEVVAEEPVAEEPVAEEPVAEAGATEEAVVDDVVAENVGDEDELFEEEEPPRPESPFDRPGRWYVVHTQSGHEKKAQQNLAARTDSMNMGDRIFESVIPMEDVVEFRQGKKVVVQKKMFPGYLLVRAHLDDDAWYVVRNTPSVVNFVGSGGKPSPLLRREVENFLHVKEEGAPATPNKRKSARLEYEMGETVRVKEGPFADFSGEIVEINEDQLKVKVLVNIFGRETPVELEFSQIARL